MSPTLPKIQAALGVLFVEHAHVNTDYALLPQRSLSLEIFLLVQREGKLSCKGHMAAACWLLASSRPDTAAEAGIPPPARPASENCVSFGLIICLLVCRPSGQVNLGGDLFHAAHSALSAEGHWHRLLAYSWHTPTTNDLAE